MNRKYTKFQEHANNTLERVQGNDVNKIQNAINETQVDVTNIYNRNFLSDSLFVLENNPYINMMFFIDFTTQDEIFRAKSKDYIMDVDNHCVLANANMATVHTVAYKSDYGNVINNFILRIDADIPMGSTIKYYITSDLTNYYPIQPGQSTSLDLGILADQCYLKIELIRNRKGESPRLYSVALYYRDELLEAQNSIKSPVLRPIPIDVTVRAGDTIIIYDPITGRVTKILEPDGSSTDLAYDDSAEGAGRLQKTTNNTGLVSVEDLLMYGSFTGSDGKVNPVLKGIRTSVVTIDTKDAETGGDTP